MIDLNLIPEIVAEDKAILSWPDGPERDEAQYDLVCRACRVLRELQPSVRYFNDDDLYDNVAQALAERNG